MMVDDGKPLTLLGFLFGERAEAARQGASARLMRWCRAFEAWLGERRSLYSKGTHKKARQSWRRFTQQCAKMPWELEAGDFEEHSRWMQAQGYAASTIHGALGCFAHFYRWCEERGIDAECEPGFNPAAEAARPKVRRYEGAPMLSRGEVEALLGLLQRDGSELGRRDYAFTLARLRLGVTLKQLKCLRWEQIETDEAGAWVRWRAEAEQRRLPEDVWEAIVAYLEASGRLAGMRAGKFIFAPLAKANNDDTGSQAEDWNEAQPISSCQLLADLKLYGRLAGIPEEKLTLQALRRTATRLRLEAGDSMAEMGVFLDSQGELKLTKHRLSKLPPLAQGEAAGPLGEPPQRKARPFKPWEGLVHGMYANRLPPEEVAALLAEGIQGMEAEIAGMRTLARGLVERLRQAQGREEEKQCLSAYTQAAARLAEMIKAERLMEAPAEGDGDKRVNEILDAWDERLVAAGEEPIGDKARAEALSGHTTGDEAGLAATTRLLREEIAGIRYVLRNAYARAMETEELSEYVRLVGIYGMGCVRLVRLMKMEATSTQGRLEAYWQATIDKALREFVEEMGLTRGLDEG